MKEPTLGVLGGLGPLATAYFLELVANMTDAAADQAHLNIIMLSSPTIPDRTAYLLGNSGQSPLPAMISLGRQLKKWGADRIAIPCITAHCFRSRLQEQIGLPIINGIAWITRTLRDAGVKNVGLMATDGTIYSGIFRQPGMKLILPGKTGQEAVMTLIYDQIKAGKPPELELFEQVRQELVSQGAEAVVLGCTELSLLKKQYCLGSGVLDALEVLAKASILTCGKPVKKEYTTLFTPCSGREVWDAAKKCTGIFGKNRWACASEDCLFQR